MWSWSFCVDIIYLNNFFVHDFHTGFSNQINEGIVCCGVVILFENFVALL
jgi:hypothetical protein